MHLERDRPLLGALAHLLLEVGRVLGDGDVDEEPGEAPRARRIAPGAEGANEPFPLPRVGEIAQRRDPAEEPRSRAAREVVGRDVSARGEELHVDVRIHDPRQDDLPPPVHDTRPFRFPRLPDAHDRPPLHGDIRPLHPERRQHARAPDDEVHLPLSSLGRAYYAETPPRLQHFFDRPGGARVIGKMQVDIPQ